MSIRTDFSELYSWLNTTPGRAELALNQYSVNAALKLQNYARNKAPWTDRTGHARQRLTGTSSRISSGYRITLAHGVNYGIWLELAHEKKYAIIQPTILVNSSEVMTGLNKLLERLKNG